MFPRLRSWPGLLAFLIVCAAAYQTQIRREMIDFGVYRTAGSRALHSQPLYQAADGHYLFKYLPAFALAAVPLALVSLETARLGWFALSAVLLLFFVRWSVYALPERRRPLSVVTWLTVLFMVKFYAHELTLGQTNILLGATLIGALIALRSGKSMVAGLLIGAATFVKPYALILLPWLVLTSGATGTLAAIAVIGTGLLLPAAVYGWQGNLALLGAWFTTASGSTRSNLLGADNISIAAMWTKWLGIGTPAMTLTLATLAGAAALALLVWKRRRLVGSPDYLEYALLMLLIPLVSPQGWDYVLLLGTPAVALVLDRWAGLTTTWKIVAASSLALMGLTVFDIMGRALYGQFMALSIVTVAALALAVVLLQLRTKRLA